MHFFRSFLALLAVFAVVSCATSAPPSEQPAQSDTSTVTSEPSANEYFVRAGEAWDDPDRALADYGRAIELDPDFVLAYFARARHYRGAGNPEAALRDYSAAIERDPGLVQAYRERGEVRMWELGDEGGADDFLLAYELDPDDLWTALAYAGLISWDDPAAAAPIYDRMVQLYPNRSDSYVARADFKQQRGDFAAALSDFRTALESGVTDPWLRAEIVMLRLATGEYAGAGADAEALVREYSDSPEAMLARARTLALSGDVDAARRFYEPYFDYDWADPRVLLELAFVLAADGAERPALDAIERYSDEKGDTLEASVARAGVALLLGAERDAMGSLEQVVRDDSWYQPAWVMLATVDPGAGERVPEFKSPADTFFPFNPDIWVWTRLYLIADPGSTPSIPLP